MGLLDFLFGGEGEGKSDIERAAIWPEPEKNTAAWNINETAGFDKEDLLDRSSNSTPEEER